MKKEQMQALKEQITKVQTLENWLENFKQFNEMAQFAEDFPEPVIKVVGQGSEKWEGTQCAKNGVELGMESMPSDSPVWLKGMYGMVFAEIKAATTSAATKLEELLNKERAVLEGMVKAHGAGAENGCAISNKEGEK